MTENRFWVIFQRGSGDGKILVQDRSTPGVHFYVDAAEALSLSARLAKRAVELTEYKSLSTNPKGE